MFWEQLYFHSCNSVVFFCFFGETVFQDSISLVIILLILISQIPIMCMCIHICTDTHTHTAYTHHIHTLTHGSTELKVLCRCLTFGVAVSACNVVFFALLELSVSIPKNAVSLFLGLWVYSGQKTQIAINFQRKMQTIKPA